MGKFTKWLGAGLGFSLGGPIGAILGYSLGSLVDDLVFKDFNKEQEEYKKRKKINTKTRTESKSTSGDFEVSLLILSSVVIKADGKVEQLELDYVRQYFVKMYGKDRANHAFKLFNNIIKKEVSSRQVCIQIRQNMTHASRLQLVHFLFGIAKADGIVNQEEEQSIQKIAQYLYINESDYISIKAMFYNEVDNAYKILEISKEVSDEEVKKAYRKMAKKYHPDRVQNLGEEHIKGAKEKFQKIQDAYEKIKSQRNFA